MVECCWTAASSRRSRMVHSPMARLGRHPQTHESGWGRRGAVPSVRAVLYRPRIQRGEREREREGESRVPPPPLHTGRAVRISGLLTGRPWSRPPSGTHR
ncbi:hypothetical protein AAFF_G00346480 [Aldrovandia affinis]|uniref:Uncharacterized protein n=1 Tax=Aldrovandia affinis TaxID=143900 RepID=A0AAD7SK16_9TELE|nr:hypothetical protein AAFF_G00346480 [Aldrovandia affinis]